MCFSSTGKLDIEAAGDEADVAGGISALALDSLAEMPVPIAALTVACARVGGGACRGRSA